MGSERALGWVFAGRSSAASADVRVEDAEADAVPLRALCSSADDKADARSTPCCDPGGTFTEDGDQSAADREAIGRNADAYMSIGVDDGA